MLRSLRPPRGLGSIASLDRVHFASFDLRDPVFEAYGFAFSVQVVTLENVYGIDPSQTSAREENGAFAVHAAGLTWAGGSERASGAVVLRVRPEGPGRVRLRVTLRAKAPEPIRCTKLLLRGLGTPLAWVEDAGDRPVGPFGECLAYPNRLGAPLVCVRAGTDVIGARFEDTRVREKRFALATERVGDRAGQGALELIHEDDATRFARESEAPPVVITRGATCDALVTEHEAYARDTYGLRRWEERTDVPSWARDLRLVTTLHGMHWTGRVLLDYAGMREALRFVTDRLPGRHVLAYIPGWEGRYYWQYGEYRPDPRLGGEAGFAALCDFARDRGAHVMPMFGGNCVNKWLPRFRDLDPAAVLKSATGNRFHGNQPDWDFSRAHDTGWQAWLNPGHPAWCDDLAGQIEKLAARYGFDGVFLDTIHVFVNDPDHSVHDGIRTLVQRLRRNVPGVLLAAEHDYDALLPLFPLFQRAYWGTDPAWTGRYAQRFAHLCEGEPEGRTGVHEFGVWRTAGARDPWEPAPGVLPTLAFQDDTLVRSQERIVAVIERIRSDASFPRGGGAT